MNIDLYNYQKEYLNLALKKVNPREYNISNLHNYFKSKNAFNNEKDKEIFIKILKDLFPVEKKEEDDILKKFKFVTISTNQTIKNLTSIEICGQNIYNLKQYSEIIQNN